MFLRQSFFLVSLIGNGSSALSAAQPHQLASLRNHGTPARKPYKYRSQK